MKRKNKITKRVKKQVSAYLDPKLYELFENYCKERNLDKSGVIAILIQMLLTHRYKDFKKIVTIHKTIFQEPQRFKVSISVSPDDSVEDIAYMMIDTMLDTFGIEPDPEQVEKAAKEISERAKNNDSH